MIRIEDLTQADIGRQVIFRHFRDVTEAGVLSSWNHRYIFCRFHSGSTAVACNPEQLTFAVEGEHAGARLKDRMGSSRSAAPNEIPRRCMVQTEVETETTNE